MNSLSSPMEAILSAAQTVLGRACCFFLACHVGVVMGALPYLASEGHVLDLLGLLVPVLLIAGDTAMLGRNLASPSAPEPTIQSG